MNNTGIWRGNRRNALIILSLLLLIVSSNFISTSVKADISIWPGILTINMPGGYPDEPIEYKIRVNNKNSYTIIVSSKTTKVEEEFLTENYTYLQNSSWISITPKQLYIPAEDRRYFNVSIDIPDSEKPLHYNEKWDARLIFEEVWASGGGGVDMRVRLGTKILIHTPSKAPTWEPSQNLSILVSIVIGVVAIMLVFMFIKKKKRDLYKRL